MNTAPASDKSETLRHIEFAGDESRLPLLLKHGMKDELLAALEETMKKHICHFQHPSRSMNGFLIAAPGELNDRLRLKHDAEGAPIIRIDGVGDLTIEGLKICFGWKKTDIQKFARRVFESTLTLDPRGKRWAEGGRMCSWEFKATLDAAKLFLTKTDPLRKQVELWVIRADFQSDYGHVNCDDRRVEQWFGRSAGKRDDHYGDDFENERKAHKFSTAVANLTMQYMLEHGMTLEDVREDFALAVIRNITRIRPETTAAVLASNGLDRSDVRVQIEVQNILPRVLKEYLFANPSYIKTWLRFDRKFPKLQPVMDAFDRVLIGLMARGSLAAAHQVALTYNSTFWHLKKQHDSIDLTPLAAKAFEVAVTNKQFGNAALLVQQFGEEACFDQALLRPRAVQESDKKKEQERVLAELCAERKTQIHEAYNVALTMGQPIRHDLDLMYVR